MHLGRERTAPGAAAPQCGSHEFSTARRLSRAVALTALQERVAALAAAVPESAGFALACGAAMAAHDLLGRSTRDLDYFAGPNGAEAV
jgi:hypothetical protein